MTDEDINEINETATCASDDIVYDCIGDDVEPDIDLSFMDKAEDHEGIEDFPAENQVPPPGAQSAGTGYYLALSLGDSREGENPCYGTEQGLFGQINIKYPNRDHASDGWIGDPSHAARVSDHNPDYSDGGIVRAIDIDSNGAPGVLTDLVRDVLKAAIGDFRVYYVIWNRKIYSSTYGWQARYYGGENPHDHHVHVSVLDGPNENNRGDWFREPFKLKPKAVDLIKVRNEFIGYIEDSKKPEPNNGVGRIQKVLNRVLDLDLEVDGIVGARTVDAWRRFERDLPDSRSLGRDSVPDHRSLAALAPKGGFQIAGKQADKR